uniref:Uncharacterized protein n=1 Tax=Vitis vinifera TaxID=29760 RepID=F6HT19_VITVI
MDIASVPQVSAAPPASIPSVNGIMNRPTISIGAIPTATVKVEPSTVTSITFGPGFPHIPSIPRAVSQGVPSHQAFASSSFNRLNEYSITLDALKWVN